MAKNPLERFKKVSGNEYAFLMDNTDNPYAVKTWVDSGCYLLNAALSNGSIFRGLPLGKRIVISGESGTAKSLFTMYIIKAYLDKVPNSSVIFFESEGASILEMADSVKIPTDKILVLPVGSINDFKNQATKILNEIKEERKEQKTEKSNYIMCLDSLGMLHSDREYKNSLEDNNAKDMSKAGDIRGLFRNITLDLSLTQTPMILTNHVYQNIGGYGNQKIQSGGGGIVFAGDIIFQLTKAKEKEGDERVGSQITISTQKSRYQREDSKYKILLLYSKGIYKYSGLLEYCIEFGIFKKDGNSYIVSDGTKVKKKEIFRNPSMYYTQEVLEKINDKLIKEVGFGETDVDFYQEENEDD